MNKKRLAKDLVCILSLLLCFLGCATRRMCPKERSFSLAMELFCEPCTADVVDKINHCMDVDALRIMAFAAHAASWPMEAGPDVEFDDKMDYITFSVLARLFAIDSEAASQSIVFFKRSFPPDGAYGFFFGSLKDGPLDDDKTGKDDNL